MTTCTMTFAEATAIRPLGENDFAADISPCWTLDDKPHGGYLMALLGRAGVAAFQNGPDPLAVSAQFLCAPKPGAAVLRTRVLKRGRTASVASVELRQAGSLCAQATVTTGRLPQIGREPPAWSDLPELLPEPPERAQAIDPESTGGVYRIGSVCDIRVDPFSAGFLAGKVGDPLRQRLWCRPMGEPPDALFSLVAGDINPSVTFNLGRFGWSPTVQMTTLLRGSPAPGWLCIKVNCAAVYGSWFDSDVTVIDSAGRLVCQARQLALTARGPEGKWLSRFWHADRHG